MLEVAPCDSSVFCTLTLGLCALFPLSYISSKTPPDTIFLLFNVDYLDHQRCGCRPRHDFPFATVPIISFMLRADSAFSVVIFAFHFRPVITEGWAFFICGLWKSSSIWKSRAFHNSYSSTSDNVGSFSFVDELCSTTFVQDLNSCRRVHFLRR